MVIKNRLLIGVLVLIGVIVFSFLLIYFKGQKINEITKINYDNLTKIVFYDGRGKNKPLTIEDKGKIKEFMAYIDGYTVRKVLNPNSTGWMYSADFYENDKDAMSITFLNPIIINKDYYNIIKGDITNDTLNKFLKSINPDWKE